MRIRRLKWIFVFFVFVSNSVFSSSIKFERLEYVNTNKSIKSLIQSDRSIDVLIHYMGWWGGGDAHDYKVDYRSDNPVYIRKIISEFKQLGIDVVAYAWFGEGSFSASSFQVAADEFDRSSIRYVLVVDRGAIRKARSISGDVTGSSTDILKKYLVDLSRNYFDRRNYYHLKGRPVVFEFGVDEEGPVDWAQIFRDFPDIDFIRIHGKGFSRPGQGAFHWVIPSEKSSTPSMAMLRHELNTKLFSDLAARFADKYKFYSAVNGFDDSEASWQVMRPHYLPGMCGKTWLSSFDNLNTAIKKGVNVTGIQLLTWNDYDEGTALEPGIESCVHLSVVSNLVRKQVLRISNTQNVDSVVYSFGTDSYLIRKFSDDFEIDCKMGGLLTIKTKPMFKDIVYKIIGCN